MVVGETPRKINPKEIDMATAITPTNTDTITYNGGTARSNGATRHYIVDLPLGGQGAVDIHDRRDRDGNRRIKITDDLDGTVLARLDWNGETDEDLIGLVAHMIVRNPSL